MFVKLANGGYGSVSLFLKKAIPILPFSARTAILEHGSNDR